MSASRKSALRISTRCCWPTEMSWIRASGSMAKPNVRASSCDALPCGRVVEEDAVAARLDGEHDVLGDGHHRDQHEVLVHHADPAADRVARRRHLDDARR